MRLPSGAKGLIALRNCIVHCSGSYAHRRHAKMTHNQPHTVTSLPILGPHQVAAPNNESWLFMGVQSAILVVRTYPEGG